MSGVKPAFCETPSNSGGLIRWAPSVPPSNQPAQLNRVCDRCIQKKIKCDLAHPSCSNCNDAGHGCTYSHVRKRPGPTKGSRRGGKTARKGDQSPENDCTTGQSASETISPLPPVADIPSSCSQQTQPITPQLTLDDTETLTLYSSLLLPAQCFELGQRFAWTINTVFPLFRQAALSEQLQNGIICHVLQSVIYALAAKGMETDFWSGNVDVHAALVSFAESAKIEAESVIEPLALNQWRTACLLAWYCFHQTPGNDQAIRIAMLSQKAYQCGLHQIDSVENQASFGWDTMSEALLEDWRHVWWAVYILDCYASFSTATPHQIETESIRTALVQNKPQLDFSQSPPSQKLFLPPDRADLWKLAQDISNTEGDNAANLHLVVSILLKEVVTTYRRHCQNPSPSSEQSMSALEDHLSAVQLALPSNYMRQTRDILRGESDSNCHWRLLTLLKMYSARLLMRLPSRSLDTPDWDVRWQENLEVCYRMVEVIQQWDVPGPPAVDPAVCFMCLSLLLLLHLHGLSSGVSNPLLHEQVARRKNIVRLFLHNYAMHWTLPRFLLDCYDALVRKLVEPLQPKDIKRILDHFNGPLHQKWLNFLSLLPPKYASVRSRKLRDPTDPQLPIVVGTGEACLSAQGTDFGRNFEFGNVFEFGNGFDFEYSLEFWDNFAQSSSL
ncbi:hypothetical protein B0J13DRAFT_553540 [Dactylonectria estremocensis]|uniref:Zn(2)-C6 fungal-type domain-containing protein n=1 Tax=Dactylonectria estremocensis TaxID=1079267 RepID=A0A9P9EUQ1_9HYPO|nr:hypothetical protein B0J13DRAFT_553540 [Dactylonectria estremocensis]